MRFTKKVVAALMVLIIMLMPLTAFASNDVITVTIDGQAVAFTDQQPIMVNSRVLVPVGGVFQALGFTPSWNGTTRTATLTRDDYTVVLTVGSANFTINGANHELDVPAQLISGRTMVPIGPILRGVGYELDWVGSTRTVVITTGTDTTPPVDPAEAEAQLAAFLADMCMESISFSVWSILDRYAMDEDVDDFTFTFGMTEYGTYPVRYRFLHLDRELDMNQDFSRFWRHLRYSSDWNTRTGDVILQRISHAGSAYNIAFQRSTFIDVGSALEIWNEYPNTIPVEILESYDGVPPWVTDNHRLYFLMGNWGYRRASEFLSINHFLSGSGHNTVRGILGVGFTTDVTEWISDNPTGYNWLALHPATPVDINAFEANYQSNRFDTQTGDVFIATFSHPSYVGIHSIFLYVDLGSAYEMFGAEQVDYWRAQGYELTEADRMFHRVELWSNPTA